MLQGLSSYLLFPVLKGPVCSICLHLVVKKHIADKSKHVFQCLLFTDDNVIMIVSRLKPQAAFTPNTTTRLQTKTMRKHNLTSVSDNRDEVSLQWSDFILKKCYALILSSSSDKSLSLVTRLTLELKNSFFQRVALEQPIRVEQVELIAHLRRLAAANSAL